MCVCVYVTEFVPTHSKPSLTPNSDHLLFPFLLFLHPPLCFTLSSTPLSSSLFRRRCKVGFPHPLRQKCVSISLCVSVALCLRVSEWCKEPFALMCPKELWLTTTHLFIHPPLPISLLSALQCCPFRPVTPSLSSSLSSFVLSAWVLPIHPFQLSPLYLLFSCYFPPNT